MRSTLQGGRGLAALVWEVEFGCTSRGDRGRLGSNLRLGREKVRCPPLALEEILCPHAGPWRDGWKHVETTMLHSYHVKVTQIGLEINAVDPAYVDIQKVFVYNCD